jgi:hypothetical protein
MNQVPSRLGATIAINLKSLGAFGTGWASWSLWPQTAEWWGLSVVSIIAGMASATLAVEAIRLMMRVRQREQAIREYLALGGAPKSSDIASGDELDRAGMR